MFVSLAALVVVLLAVAARFFSLADAIGGRAGTMMKMAMARNLSLKMYGKVLDQQDLPVSGAKVTLVVGGGGPYAPGSGLMTLKTDAEGIFTVDASGHELLILSVEHPQLTRVLYRSRGGSIESGAENLVASDSDGKEYSWRTYNTRGNPFVMHAWRVEKFEKVKADSGYLEPVPGGKTYEHAGIVASCEREPKDPQKHWREQKGSWSITLRAIEGGIQESNDIYLNVAPEAGYQPQITVSMQRDDSGYRPNIIPARRYYYTANKGKLYGAVSAIFEPYMEADVCTIGVHMKYNQNGSRNIAIKPHY